MLWLLSGHSRLYCSTRDQIEQHRAGLHWPLGATSSQCSEILTDTVLNVTEEVYFK